MAYIIWSDFFSVNVPYIDRQHQKLFEIINVFYDSVKKGNKKEKVFKVLNELTLYCEKHFKDEEKLLEQRKYPQKEFSLHKKYHEQLLSDIFKLTEVLEKQEDNIVYQMECFFNAWLIKHILFQDKKYELFFHDKNIV